MAVGEASFPAMPAIEGIRLGTAMAGIKAPGRRDLVVIELPEATTLAAAFTRNAFCAAPVHVARRHLETDRPRYLLINTGNANAGTGEQGMHDAEQSCQALGELTGVAAQCVLPFSTGVIGEPLPVTRLCDALPEALAALSVDGWQTAGEGILTTDTRAKGATTCIEIDGQPVTINGIAKGSGMIKPDMATMLSFVFTDAAIDDARLQVLLRRAVDESFNCITVDSDTSTNDACTLAATGRGVRIGTDEHEARFAAALTEVLVELAQAIIRDAEGATKFVTLEVEGATDRQEALDVAFTVAHSPLVKTALYASDANWGRILAAVGRAPVPDLDVSRISIDLGDVALVERGGRAASYTEAAGSAVMAESEITIRIHLGRGDVAATVWTSDLSHDYVSINADYRS
ncbi:bifunctional glutamate N-acetyltransferase/amino-acid acetyltransferase ArgJ [Chromohalobacter canadensis]|uniref:bifunctional glutamate N-acetyltransferase/amino-acid acetyltransferase ArgJ n=1 Tax=Chromohalobacter canadensis TaxID=141389 RepID=UPI0021C14045|nr:bifunctional glutamate N-acetyltransferase/amino-acid acetyltransferase ArgJ [Chromohalobacter canadensis]MCT8469548.1 bifunctional glutamate N-acetyltransferase/amino-acid acetyltransferase ArgJ [Chromohalobacter canadensis]MCT8472172.1 bifunctional glutamate N-acetyltransferase/amino-acid acetyltransferase ArgJ [Chromohalobacter canadensis]MCT8499716.1 bifunctional glutamate N-acetyltransferase/amino-acid acetyltransferase ArgJ [Chromohalobacter canadensis]